MLYLIIHEDTSMRATTDLLKAREEFLLGEMDIVIKLEDGCYYYLSDWDVENHPKWVAIPQ